MCRIQAALEGVTDRASASRTCRWFFFFQAEDGIRDYKVTGVQTCALPIYRHERRIGRQSDAHERVGESRDQVQPAQAARGIDVAERHVGGIRGVDLRADVVRSEERRVGKECRSRWSPYH